MVCLTHKPLYSNIYRKFLITKNVFKVIFVIIVVNVPFWEHWALDSEMLGFCQANDQEQFQKKPDKIPQVCQLHLHNCQHCCITFHFRKRMFILIFNANNNNWNKQEQSRLIPIKRIQSNTQLLNVAAYRYEKFFVLAFCSTYKMANSNETSFSLYSTVQVPIDLYFWTRLQYYISCLKIYKLFPKQNTEVILLKSIS